MASAIRTTLLTVTDLQRVYLAEPRDFDALPAASIAGPSLRRRGPEEHESQLGATDWLQTWSVRLYVALDDPETAEQAVRSLLGQVVAAVDADRGLGGQALDAAITESTPGFSDADEQRQLRIVECTLEVWSLVL